MQDWQSQNPKAQQAHPPPLFSTSSRHFSINLLMGIDRAFRALFSIKELVIGNESGAVSKKEKSDIFAAHRNSCICKAKTLGITVKRTVLPTNTG